MGEGSAIEWTDHTFNPWWGCTRVSPGCDHCYADTWARRTGYDRLWDGERRFFGDIHWRDPIRWALKARGKPRQRVFCASMADVFDNHRDLDVSRGRLWGLIASTPELDWLVLTKRIGNVRKMLPADWGDGYPNVWLGISIVNQEEADRDVPKLLQTPAALRFLSCEPLLGPVDLHAACDRYRVPDSATLDWVIVGGESGHGARPMDEWWAVHILQECQEAGVAFFMKQGSQANWPRFKDFESFPEELRVRQWPMS